MPDNHKVLTAKPEINRGIAAENILKSWNSAMYQLLDPPRLTDGGEPGAERVTARDPWTGATWKVYGGSHYLKPAARVGDFTLTGVPDPVTGATAYYRVEFADGCMPNCWQGCLLYPRGFLAVPSPVPLLPPWSPGTDGRWRAAAATALEGLNVTMSRLEGDLHLGSSLLAFTVVRVDNSSTQGAPLLAMQLLSSNLSGEVHPLADGTAHGTTANGRKS
jgi:hypothetical protein